MAIPNDIAVIDTMIGLPSVERRDWQESMAGVLRDKGSRGFTHPAGERHQFGRPIGSYQALKHRMADDWTGLEFARPMVWRAAWSLTHDLPDATWHVSAAKAATNDAASRAARTAAQVHGALGYTFACDVQLFLKRTLALTNEYGDTHHHRRRLADVLRTRDIERVP